MSSLTLDVVMFFLWFGLLFITLGGKCDRLLLMTDEKFLLVDPTTNITETLDLDENSIPHAMGYHYSKGMLFYASHNKENTSSSVKRVSIPFKPFEQHVDINVKHVDDLSIDWIHDRIYFLVKNKVKVHMTDLHGNNIITIFTREKVKDVLITQVPDLADAIWFKDLQIDPFQRTLFMLVVENNPNNDNDIVRSFLVHSDLDGKNLKLQSIHLPRLPLIKLNIQQKTLFIYGTADEIWEIVYYNARGIEYSQVNFISYRMSKVFSVVGSNIYLLNEDVKTSTQISKINLLEGVKSQELYYYYQNKQKTRIRRAAANNSVVLSIPGQNGRPITIKLTSRPIKPPRYDDKNLLKVKDFQIFEQYLQSNRSAVNLRPSSCTIEGCSHGCFIQGIATCDCPPCYMLYGDYETCQDEKDPILEQLDPQCRKKPQEPDNSGSEIEAPASGGIPTSRVCTVPHLPDTVISRPDCLTCNYSRGDTVASSHIIVATCTSGNQFVSELKDSFSICQDGTWDPPLPPCHKLCPPLKSLTLDLQCWRGADSVSCLQPLLPNTTATYRCKEYHEVSYTSQPSGIRCNADGAWSRDLPHCTPKCGLSNLHSFQITPVIVGGNTSQPGNFPWHAAIYHNKSSQWEAVCGGTLVSSKAILTAAHCVTLPCKTCKSPVMTKADVMVALGKHYRDWYISEETEAKRRVKEIRVHPNYVGSSLNFIQDIALIIVELDVEINNFIMPACIDYLRDHITKVTSKTQGYVAGWGNTEECSPTGNTCVAPSDQLKFAKTTILGFSTCYNFTQTIKGYPVARITPDKFCSSNAADSVVQAGDSGGGLTFTFGGVHFVYGIVSVKLKLQIKNQTLYNFGVFTKVPTYLDWISSNLY